MSSDALTRNPLSITWLIEYDSCAYLISVATIVILDDNIYPGRFVLREALSSIQCVEVIL